MANRRRGAISLGYRTPRAVSTQKPITGTATPAKVQHKAVIVLPESLFKLLRSAADRRHMTVDQLASEVVGGTIAKGSIDAALARWGDYCTSSRTIGPWKKKKKLDADAPEKRESGALV